MVVISPAAFVTSKMPTAARDARSPRTAAPQPERTRLRATINVNPLTANVLRWWIGGTGRRHRPPPPPSLRASGSGANAAARGVRSDSAPSWLHRDPDTDERAIAESESSAMAHYAEQALTPMRVDPADLMIDAKCGAGGAGATRRLARRARLRSERGVMRHVVGRRLATIVGSDATRGMQCLVVFPRRLIPTPCESAVVWPRCV